jgi:iron complex transport system substrate-binding protein
MSGSAATLAWSAAAAFALSLTLGVASHARDAFILRDDLQREVAFSGNPQRIISMLPSLTETVCALGGCDRLVATDRFSNWPEQVKRLPKVGGLGDASIESIVGLKPDLILMSRSQRITDRLAELGIRTFALKTDTYADIGRSVKLVGQILGLPERAASLVQTIEASVSAIADEAIAQRHGARPTVYYEVDRAPYAAGPQSYIGEMLARLGTRNIVTADLGPFPQLNPEYVVRNDPDVIFVAPAEVPHLAERPGWDRIRAVRENRLCSFSSDVRDTIVRPGPRVSDGMRALEECLVRVAP